MFEKAFPYYLSIGMSYQEFWCGVPHLVTYYSKAEEIRKAKENEKLWLQGLYNFRAFRSVIDNFSYGMNNGKGKKPDGYVENPIPITDYEIKREKQRRIKKTLEFFKKGQDE